MVRFVKIAVVALVAVLLPRWRRRSRGPMAAPQPELAPADRARLDSELARYEG